MNILGILSFLFIVFLFCWYSLLPEFKKWKSRKEEREMEELLREAAEEESFHTKKREERRARKNNIRSLSRKVTEYISAFLFYYMYRGPLEHMQIGSRHYKSTFDRIFLNWFYEEDGYTKCFIEREGTIYPIEGVFQGTVEAFYTRDGIHKAVNLYDDKDVTLILPRESQIELTNRTCHKLNNSSLDVWTLPINTRTYSKDSLTSIAPLSSFKTTLSRTGSTYYSSGSLEVERPSSRGHAPGQYI